MELVARITHALVSAAEAARLDSRKDLLRCVGHVASVACAEVPGSRFNCALRTLANFRA